MAGTLLQSAQNVKSNGTIDWNCPLTGMKCSVSSRCRCMKAFKRMFESKPLSRVSIARTGGLVLLLCLVVAGPDSNTRADEALPSSLAPLAEHVHNHRDGRAAW